MTCGFCATDILVPKDIPIEKWAVIACDQFTSDEEYWNRVASVVGDTPSTFHMVLPEIYLGDNSDNRIDSIVKAMETSLAKNVFAEYKDTYIYVERTLRNGTVRQGIVGAVDLEQYHYDPAQKPSIGATEQTVLERVPPRIAVRRIAPLEFSHVIIFCNDFENRIIQPVALNKENLPKLYDAMLMEDGGHLSAWLVTDPLAQRLQQSLAAYQNNACGTAFLVADGNHSLVTAKCWYEELKKLNPSMDISNHPARYALVELENILDSAIDFEPIHRVIFNVDTEKFIRDLQSICMPGGSVIDWIIGDKHGRVTINVPKGELPVAVLQRFLDSWLSENTGKIDYIHDKDAVESLAKKENTVGLLLPVFDKAELFAFGASGNILPRKTFSLGYSREKRYYLEGRRIR